MSFRGRGGPRGGGGRGGGGGGNFRGRGGGGGGGGNNFRKFDAGPPDRVIPVGYFDYACQDDLVCKVTIEDVPYFNAPIFLENKEQIGKIDEIFGNLRDYYVSIKLGDNMKASSFKSQQKVCITCEQSVSKQWTQFSDFVNSFLAALHRSSQIVAVEQIFAESTATKGTKEEGTTGRCWRSSWRWTWWVRWRWIRRRPWWKQRTRRKR